MDGEGVAVLSGPLVHVDDLHADAVLLQEQGRDETDRTGADDEDFRIGVMGHRASSNGVGIHPDPICTLVATEAACSSSIVTPMPAT